MGLIRFNYKVEFVNFFGLESALNQLKENNWDLYQVIKDSKDCWIVIARKAI